MIYKITLMSENCESYGFHYCGSKAAAKKYIASIERGDTITETETLKTPKTKKEVLDLLCIHGSHPDNG